MRNLSLIIAPVLAAGCEPSVATVELEPQTVTMRAKGETKTFKATPKDAKGELAVEALLEIQWSSSDDSVATVINGGVTAVRSGEATITAAVGERSATGKVIVSIPAKLSLEPAELEVPGVGRTGSLKVIAKDALGKDVLDPQIVWATSSSSVAMVSGAGEVQGVGIGDTTVTAKLQGLEARAVVHVRFPPVARLEIASGQRELEKVGDAVRLTATPYDASGAEIRGLPVEWSSSDERIATVSNEGLVTAAKRGKVTISATAGDRTETVEIVSAGRK